MFVREPSLLHSLDQPKPFNLDVSNDRVFLDIVFIKNVNGDTFSYLNVLDDASTYQVLDRLLDRSEAVVVKKLVDGWFKYFGFPLTLVVDAEGALRGFKFENLVAQCGIQLRFVPPDAHWQLGKCERHGQAAKWIARKLVNQFAALHGEEMDIVVNMAVHAKNSMVRRCGASPRQWVFGRQPRVPTALLSEPESVEAKSMVDSNDALLQIEMIRHEAMKAFADYEFNQTLRKAMLRKGRPYRGPLEVGQRVAYFRHKTQLDGEGTVEGYRQGLIIGLDPGPTGSVWIRNSRGRVIQAAREQVRGVEGEELWSPSLDDIQALKDAESDLSEKHPQAFDHRSTAPSAIEDKRAIEALEAAGQPQLPADDAKVLVPVPSPAEIESRRSSKTDTQVSVPSVRTNPGTPFIYLPPTPTLPAPGTPGLEAQQAALPPIPEDDEPNTLRESSKPTSSLPKLEDAPLQLTRPSSTSTTSKVGQGVKRSSDVSHEMLRDESKIPSSSARGQKRDAEVAPHALQQQIQSEPSQAQQQQKGPEMHSALLAYCKHCGTSNSTIASREECPRCGSEEFVDNPVLVKNWFDEVEEHEAMHQTKDFVFDPYYKRWLDRWPEASGRFDLPRDDFLEESLHSEAFITGVGQVFSQLPEGAPTDEPCLWSVAMKADSDSQWEWQKVFETIDLDADVVAESMKFEGTSDDRPRWAFVRHGQGSSRKVRPQQQQPEHRFLHRHGRHCVHVTGWDGSAPELQPAFCDSNFVTAYLPWCDAVRQGQQICDDEQIKDAQHEIDMLQRNDIYDVVTANMVSTTPVFNVCNVQAEQLFQAESSGDEDEAETSGRAAKQA